MEKSSYNMQQCVTKEANICCFQLKTTFFNPEIWDRGTAIPPRWLKFLFRMHLTSNLQADGTAPPCTPDFVDRCP